MNHNAELLVSGVALIALGLLAPATACGTKPACSPESLAAIEAEYIAEAVKACEGETYDSCKTLPAVRAKYQAKRAAWVSCQ